MSTHESAETTIETKAAPREDAPVHTTRPSEMPDTAGPVASKETDLVTGLTLDALRDLLQASGLRVETVRDGGAQFLRSATNGLAFDIRPGNTFAPATDRFADVTFFALFSVSGTLPLDLLNRWNQSRRFARLFLDSPAPDRTFLVFCMDVSVAGGVTPAQVRNQIALWDGLVQQLIPWLREEVSKIAPSVDTTSNATRTAETPAASTI